MDKKRKEWSRVLWADHLWMSIILLVIMILLRFVLDKLANHFIIDSVEQRYGYDAAVFLRNHKTQAIAAVFAAVLFLGWIWVEFREFRRVNAALTALEAAFSGEEEVCLEERYRSVENAVNTMKLENRKYREDMRREEERKNDLITYLAHDIRTPLASVIGYLSLLEEMPDLPVKQRSKYIGVTLKKANRLEELVDEFFDITRFNLSKIPLEKEKVPLRFLLEQLAEEFYPVLMPAHKTIRLEVPEELFLYADPDKIARVFANLIKNAAAYSYEDTEILIRAEHVRRKQDTGLYLRVTVENEGKEIAKEKLEQIFDKFFRLDNARTTGTGGAGLGLAIAKEIVLQHEGMIFAESCQGHTRFTVLLPAEHLKKD